ncbi:hypothetical protein SPRG_09002 [Saprolegnia parasitica CBS 223.65]|uniref:Major facilitator superfamily associated domain-containing protein n=1 Tax=Saprolegnia parasitica (strain CBS 223.65) TaxID=695850 RepID=A0A067C5E1_SAPPC|nr:hypothetical protein SPRG_09002 [Saprolegnia parasitica CBS 223.65]KDO25703.1 hypothetical protein SPRG_09002 [Saprolegnia parasitica CBS 223.65]|eukprot:XP_012203513.1 hypothetical protein SPRG_09002 [Saprolegnia parasitica CBS 223.65]
MAFKTAWTLPTPTSSSHAWIFLESSPGSRSESRVSSHASDFGSGLRAGPAPELQSPSTRGLLLQYACIGLVTGALPLLPTAIFQDDYDAHLASVYLAVCTLPLLATPLLGLLADCLPLGRRRRRVCIVLGWALCAVSCLAMAITPLRTRNATSLHVFCLLMTACASFGCAAAAAASEALLVTYAQTERIWERGQLQTRALVLRTTGTLVPQVLLGAMALERVSVIYALLAVASVGAASATILFVTESVPDMSTRHYLHLLWATLQQRVVWQLCAFQVLFSVGFYVSSFLGSAPWLALEARPVVWFNLGGTSIAILALVAMGLGGLGLDWRQLIVVNTALYTVGSATVHLCSLYGALPDEYTYLVVTMVLQAPLVVVLLPANYCIVEVASVGAEGAVAGLVSACALVARPVAALVYRALQAAWPAATSKTNGSKLEATRLVFVVYFLQAMSLLWLHLLPRQKAHVVQLKLHGGSSATGGGLLLLGVGLMVAFSATMSILPTLSTTSCLWIAGGSGCN